MIRVLFLCQKNNLLSQVAEGLMNKMSGRDFHAWSAGFEPAPLHPLVKKAMAERDIPLMRHSPKSVRQFSQEPFDYVIWVGEEALIEWPATKGDSTVYGIWHAHVPAPETVPEAEFLHQINVQIQFLATRIQLFVLAHHDAHHARSRQLAG